MRALVATGAMTLVVLAGCKEDKPTPGMPLATGARAAATLANAAGETVGTATALDVAGGLRLSIEVKGVPAGLHGTHVHMTGKCEGPAFQSAGSHWNPSGKQHGSMNPAGPHHGDLPNLVVGNDGRGTLGMMVPGASVADMLDADGAAIIVHANADDLMSDPTGNSGGRIACGVFVRQ